MCLSISVGLLDGFGLAMFLPLLQMAGDTTPSSPPQGLGNLQFIIRGMIFIGLKFNLNSVLLVLAFFFIFKGLAQLCNGFYEVALRQFFFKKTRMNLTESLSKISFESFVKADVGRIQNTMTGEVGNVILAYQRYFECIQYVIQVIVYMLFVFFVNAKFAALICIGAGLTNIIYKQLYSRTKKISANLTAGANVYQGLIIQFVANFKYLKATGSLDKYNSKLIEAIIRLDKSWRKIGKLNVILATSREPLLIVVVCLVIFIQVNAMHGSLASILVSLLFFYRGLNSLVQMQTAYNDFLSVSGSMANMTSFQEDLKRAEEVDGTRKVGPFKRNILLKDAFFSYRKDQPIIKNINLSIKKNETVAVVGESGSGKTTLVNVLVGLLPLSSGKMEIDGINRRDIRIATYQKRIGYITQEPVVFNDTIFNNVTFWEEPGQESLQKFNRAIQLASIANFINELPEKEQTLLGNNGINLSGGQKQRISIARELYKDVDILVLDEATSALDSETERAIQKSIDALKGKYTVLIVAHRLSTIKNASRILLMDKGEIIDEGDFFQMIRTSDKFRRMVELQEMAATN